MTRAKKIPAADMGNRDLLIGFEAAAIGSAMALDVSLHALEVAEREELRKEIIRRLEAGETCRADLAALAGSTREAMERQEDKP